jgi:hypothetical protein
VVMLTTKPVEGYLIDLVNNNRMQPRIVGSVLVGKILIRAAENARHPLFAKA